MLQWVLYPNDPKAHGSPPRAIEWWTGEGGYGHLIDFGGDRTDDYEAVSVTMPLRIFSHWFIDQMPNAGVREATETLVSLFRFYSDRLMIAPYVQMRAPSFHVDVMPARRRQFAIESDE